MFAQCMKLGKLRAKGPEASRVSQNQPDHQSGSTELRSTTGVVAHAGERRGAYGPPAWADASEIWVQNPRDSKCYVDETMLLRSKAGSKGR